MGDNNLKNLPACAIDFIKLVVKKMRYRKKVRVDVQAELTAHFEDALKDCKTDEQKEKTTQKLIGDFGDVKLLAALMRRAKKRCRPLWRTIVARTAQAIVLAFVCLVIYIAWFLTGKPVITTNYVEEMNLAARPTIEVDPNQNAAPFYIKAAESLEQMQENKQIPENINELFGEKYTDLSDEQKQDVDQWMEDNKQLLDLARAGAKKPYYWIEYKSKNDETISVLMPHLSPYRKLAYLMARWQAYKQAEAGQYEKAYDDLLTCYRLGQHFRGNKTLIEQLVGIAIEAFAVEAIRDITSNYPVEPNSLAALQNDFENIIANEDFTINMESEKYFLYDEIQRSFTEDRIGGGHISLQGLKRIEMLTDSSLLEVWLNNKKLLVPLHILFTHPNKQQTKETVDRFYSFLEKMVHKTPAQLRNEDIDINKQAMKIVKGNVMLEILAPAFGKLIKQSHWVRTDTEATLTIIAILRYNQDKGHYPENLDKLIETGYLKELPIDLYSDKSLVYKKTDEGFMLYSFGEDFDDDGGKPFVDKKGRPQKWPSRNQDGDAILWPIQK